MNIARHEFEGILVNFLSLFPVSANPDAGSTSGMANLWVNTSDGTLNYKNPAGTSSVVPTLASLDFGETGDLAQVSTAAAAGSSSEIARADHVHAIAAGTLAADATGRALMASGYFNAATVDAKFGTDSIGEDRLTANELSGRVVANVATGNVIGGIPVEHMFTIGDAAGNTDITLTHKTMVTDVHVIKRAGAGGAGDTVQVFNGASAISNAMSLNVSDKAVVRAGEIDDATHVVAAAATLRVTIVDGNAGATDLSCYVFVKGFRSA